MGEMYTGTQGTLVRVLLADLAGKRGSEDNGRSGGKREYSGDGSGKGSN